MFHRSILFFVLTLLASSTARADFLCCDLVAGTCSFAPPDRTQLSTACPRPNADGWIVTLATLNRTGGATIGATRTAAPFHGVCLGPPAVVVGGALEKPTKCVPILPTGGLQLKDSVFTNPPKKNAWIIVGDNLARTFPRGDAHCAEDPNNAGTGDFLCRKLVFNCWAGGIPRELHDGNGNSRVYDGSYSCQAGQAPALITDPLVTAGMSSKWIGDVEIPAELVLPSSVPALPIVGVTVLGLVLLASAGYALRLRRPAIVLW